MTVPALHSDFDPQQCCLLICDIQERFRTLLPQFDQISLTAKCLLETAQVLHLPIVATEQSPSKLGHTVEELSPLMKDAFIAEKTCFSMLCDDVIQHLHSKNPSYFIITGQETHVCVLQTVYHLRLLFPSATVFVVSDGVDSQRNIDREVALTEFGTLSNVCVCSAQSLLFRLIGDAKHPSFRQISAIAKNLATLK
ncbi:hypothetical protein GEMRC1_006058 [Eukaryota sp. GEM-RC1]